MQELKVTIPWWATDGCPTQRACTFCNYTWCNILYTIQGTNWSSPDAHALGVYRSLTIRLYICRIYPHCQYILIYARAFNKSSLLSKRILKTVISQLSSMIKTLVPLRASRRNTLLHISHHERRIRRARDYGEKKTCLYPI